MHSRFSEFNDNAETLSYVTVDNGACVTTKLRQNLQVTTFLSAFLGSLLSMTMMYRLGKATKSVILFYLCHYSLRFGNLRRGDRLLK